MINTSDPKYLEKYEIARGDRPEPYENSGWIALLDGDYAAIVQFGHCSCYDTLEAIGSTFDWYGTPAELLAMAERLADPTMPERTANPKDYDYGLLVAMYEGVKRYFAEKESR